MLRSWVNYIRGDEPPPTAELSSQGRGLTAAQMCIVTEIVNDNLNTIKEVLGENSLAQIVDKIYKAQNREVFERQYCAPLRQKARDIPQCGNLSVVAESALKLHDLYHQNEGTLEALNLGQLDEDPSQGSAKAVYGNAVSQHVKNVMNSTAGISASAQPIMSRL